MRKSETVIWVGVVCLLCAGTLAAQQTDASAASASAPPAAAAKVPRLVKFSGELRDLTGQPLRGLLDVNFEIYTEQTDASPLWQETQTLQLDDQGRYSVLLGATQVEGLPVELFTTGEARWLGVQAAGAEAQPRVLLVSVPYALKAGDAETLGGKPASAYALAASGGKVSATVVGVAAPAAGGASAAPGTEPAALVTSGATNFTDTTTDQVVKVFQSGSGYGLHAVAGNNSAVFAQSLATSGATFTVRGITLSSSGVGVYGESQAAAGSGYGVRGQSASDAGGGVLGINTSPTGVAYGVMGITDSAEGVALAARARATTGAALGVQAITYSPSGVAVSAHAEAASGPTTGVLARVGSAEGTALVIDNVRGGKLLSAWSNGVEKLTVDGKGNLNTSGDLTAAGNGIILGNVAFGDTTNMYYFSDAKLVVIGNLAIAGAPGVNGIIYPDGTKQTSAVGPFSTVTDVTSMGGVPAGNYARLDKPNYFTWQQTVNGALTVKGKLTASEYHGDISTLTVNGISMTALQERLQALENIVQTSTSLVGAQGSSKSLRSTPEAAPAPTPELERGREAAGDKKQ